MTYELAKELKDAGFPQNGERHWYCGGHIYFHDNDEGKYEECDEKEPYTDNDHYCHSAMLTAEFIVEIPTLEELIEACGEEFEHLDQRFPGWRASGGISNDAKPSHYVECSTPTEAVARLWLALNQRKE